MDTLNVDQSDTLKQLQQHNGDAPLPPGNTPVEPQAQAQPEPPPEPPANQPEPSPSNEGMVEVDGQQFASEKDARDYLQQKYNTLEQERLLDEARIEGMQTAMQYQPQSQSQTPVDSDPEPQWDENKYYEDPAGYQRSYTREHSAWLERKMERKWQQRQAATQQEQEVWNTFVAENPDLADFKDDVDKYVAANAESVKAMVRRDPKKARAYVATQVRAKFQRWVEAQTPTKVLSNTKHGPSLGGNPPVTQPQKTPTNSKPVDFTAQLRSMRSRPVKG
jgi:hypothetical protein